MTRLAKSHLYVTSSDVELPVPLKVACGAELSNPLPVDCGEDVESVGLTCRQCVKAEIRESEGVRYYFAVIDGHGDLEESS